MRVELHDKHVVLSAGDQVLLFMVVIEYQTRLWKDWRFHYKTSNQMLDVIQRVNQRNDVAVSVVPSHNMTHEGIVALIHDVLGESGVTCEVEVVTANEQNPSVA